MDVMSWKSHSSSEYLISAHAEKGVFLLLETAFCCMFYNRSQATVFWKPSSEALLLAVAITAKKDVFW